MVTGFLFVSSPTVTVYRINPDTRLAENIGLQEAINLCLTNAEELKEIEEILDANTDT